MFSVVGFEGAVMGLVKVNENRHDLTGEQPGGADSRPGARSQHSSRPTGLKTLPEIVDITEQLE